MELIYFTNEFLENMALYQWDDVISVDIHDAFLTCNMYMVDKYAFMRVF